MHENVLKGLYHRRARFATGHFRVVQTDHTYKLYREQTHAPVGDVGTRWCDDMGQYTDESIQAQAEEALSLFLEWKSMAVPHADALTQGLPLVTTPSRLARIVEHVESKGLDFNYLGPEEIMAAGAEIGANLIRPFADYRGQA